MRLIAIAPIAVVALSAYFVFMIDVFPEKYLDKEQLEPSPYFEAELSESQIFLGESFRIEINTKNIGDYGDIHILSAAFPTITEIGDTVKIVHYDLSHSPQTIKVGDEVGSDYSGGVQTILAQYPSIEAMNRPMPAGSEFTMGIMVIPDKPGPFVVYVKSIAIPHTSDASHYPREGKTDHQNEFVKEFTVDVVPREVP